MLQHLIRADDPADIDEVLTSATAHVKKEKDQLAQTKYKATILASHRATAAGPAVEGKLAAPVVGGGVTNPHRRCYNCKEPHNWRSCPVDCRDTRVCTALVPVSISPLNALLVRNPPI